MRAGLRVPDGFAITTSAFDDHLDRFGDPNSRDALCAEIDHREQTGSTAVERQLCLDRVSRETLRESSSRRRGVVGVRRRGGAELGGWRGFARRIVRRPARLDSPRIEPHTSRARRCSSAGRRSGRRARCSIDRRAVCRRAGWASSSNSRSTRGRPACCSRRGQRRDARRVHELVSPTRWSRCESIRTASRSIAGRGAVRAHSTVSGSRSTRRARQCRSSWIVRRALEARVRRAAGRRVGGRSRATSLWIVQSRPITAPVALRPRARGERRGDLVVERERQRELPAADLALAVFDRVAPGYTHYFRNLANAFGISPRARSRDGAVVPPDHRRSRRADVLQPDVDSFGAAARAVRRARSRKSFDTFVGADGGARRDDSRSVDAAEFVRWREVARIAARDGRPCCSGRGRASRASSERSTVRGARRTVAARLRRCPVSSCATRFADSSTSGCNRWLDASLADAASMVCYGALERLLRTRVAGRTPRYTRRCSKRFRTSSAASRCVVCGTLSRLVRRDAALAELFDTGERAGGARAHPHRAASSPSFAWHSSRISTTGAFGAREELMLTTPSFQEDPAPLDRHVSRVRTSRG